MEEADAETSWPTCHVFDVLPRHEPSILRTAICFLSHSLSNPNRPSELALGTPVPCSFLVTPIVLRTTYSSRLRAGTLEKAEMDAACVGAMPLVWVLQHDCGVPRINSKILVKKY